MHKIRRTFGDCVVTGLLYATAITALAVVMVAVGGAIQFVTHGLGGVHVHPGQVLIAVVTVVGSYYVAGLLGGMAYYALQGVSDRYLGQVLLAFVLGGIAFGVIGLSGTLAYVCFGLNMFDLSSSAEGWRILPEVVLIAALMTAVLGPLIWRAKRS